MSDPSYRHSDNTGASPWSPDRLRALFALGAKPALLIAAAVFILVLIIRSTGPAQYVSTASLLVTSPQSGLQSLGIITPPPIDAGAYRTLILHGPIVPRVLQQAGGPFTLDAQEDLQRNLNVAVQGQQVSSVIQIEVTDLDPARAALLANTIATAVVDWDRDRARQSVTTGVATQEETVWQLETQLEQRVASGGDTASIEQQLQVQRAALAASRERLQSLAVVPAIEILSEAVPAAEPQARLAFPLAVLAAIFSFVLVIAVLAARETLVRRVRSADEAADMTGLTPVATFPARGARDFHRLQAGAADDARDAILTENGGARPLVVMVTSAVQTAGKGLTSWALAESFARAGHKTLVIDANLRQPGSAAALGLSEGSAVTVEDYLLEPKRRRELVSVRRPDGTRFSVIPGFRPNRTPARLLEEGLADMIRAWQRRFEVIILDSPAALPHPDIDFITPMATHVVLTDTLGSTNPERLAGAADRLRKVGALSMSIALIEQPNLLNRFKAPVATDGRNTISILRERATAVSQPEKARKD